jgi:3'-5' exonuclease
MIVGTEMSTSNSYFWFAYLISSESGIQESRATGQPPKTLMTINTEFKISLKWIYKLRNHDRMSHEVSLFLMMAGKSIAKVAKKQLKIPSIAAKSLAASVALPTKVGAGGTDRRSKEDNSAASILTNSAPLAPRTLLIERRPLSAVVPDLHAKMKSLSVRPAHQNNDMTVYVFKDADIANTFIKFLVENCGEHLRLLGVDTETNVNWNQGSKLQATSTIQVAFGEGLVAIFQVFRMCGLSKSFDPSKFPKHLQLLLENRRILKVGVGLSSDTENLGKHYPFNLRNVIDLDSIASSLQLPSVGLGGLAYLYCDKIELDKRKKLIFSRWDVDLKLESILYAARDAEYSRRVYERMVSMPALKISKEELQVILKRNK